MSGVRVGIVGTTDYAETHLRRLAAHPAARLQAVAGRDPDRARAVAHRHGIPNVYAGYEELLASDSIDAIVVVAPDELHEPIALQAIERGIHVLCEKPLAASSEAAGRMARAAAESELVTMSYFGLRTGPHHRYLRELLERGAIGEIRSASFSLAHGMFRSNAYNWRFDAARGGGVIADLGCYLFDLARWYVGEVVAVSARGASYVERMHPAGLAFEAAADSCVGILEFDTGAQATFEASVISHVGDGFQRNSVTLQGATGRIELEHTFAGAALRIVRDAGVEELRLPADFAAPSGDAEFLDAILGGHRVEPSFADGAAVQQIVAAAERAAAERKWIDVRREDRP